MKFDRSVYIFATLFLALFLLTTNAYAARFNLNVGPDGSLDATDVNGDFLIEDATGSTSIIFAGIKEATFTMTPDASFQVADVLLDGSSVGAVVSYHWVKPEPDPLGTHTFDVTFEPNPVASFELDSASPPSGSSEPSAVVKFNDTSMNNPTAWLWNFGDGTTSTQRNPTHTYTTYGTFSVTLTVYNNQGQQVDTTLPMDYSVVQPTITYQTTAGPNGSISAAGPNGSLTPPGGPYTVPEGTSTTFTIIPDEYYMVANVQAIDESGTVYDYGQATTLEFYGTTDLADYTISASFEPIPVVASFSGPSGEITTDDQVLFTDNSTPQDNLTFWNWYIGTELISTDQVPSTVIFDVAGDYTVILEVGNAATSNTYSADYAVVSSYTSYPVTVGDTQVGYDSIMAAYNAIPSTGDTIKMKAGEITEDLIFDDPVTFELKGGYYEWDGSDDGYTKIKGIVEIAFGTVTVSKVIIAPAF